MNKIIGNVKERSDKTKMSLCNSRANMSFCFFSLSMRYSKCIDGDKDLFNLKDGK